ncbi:MAG: hypothetical protein Q4E75_06945, partial [bacterium]|nr:hypothetical protein [bacterium]
RYFKEIPFKNVFFYLITLYSGSLVLYVNGISRFYELLIVFGLFFVLLGIFFVLKSVENEKNKYLNLFWGSLFLALSVACRPIDLLISIIILPYIFSLLIKDIKEFKTNKLNLFKLILSVGIPYILVGISLMYYNYIRFDSPFEFGYKYQLTISNNSALSTGWYTIFSGVFTNLFSFPKFNAEFPFIVNYNDVPTFYGYYYIENMLGGLFAVVPLCFIYFGIIKINKENISKELKILIFTLFIVSIGISIVSVAMSGSVERYLMDYSWMFIIDSIIIFSIIYNSFKHDETKNVMQNILYITTIFTFIIALLFGIVSEKSFFKRISPNKYYEMEYTICFWE